MRLKSDDPLNNPLTLEVLSKETKSSIFGQRYKKKGKAASDVEKDLLKSSSIYDRNNTKTYQGTKPDIIAGVTDKPTERSERLWRSTKSPPHPETVARRDREQASDMTVISTSAGSGNNINHAGSANAAGHSDENAQEDLQLSQTINGVSL